MVLNITNIIFFIFYFFVKFKKKIEKVFKKNIIYILNGRRKKIIIKVPKKKEKLSMDDILAKKTDISDSTRKVYSNVIKRLIKLFFKFDGKKKENIDYMNEFFETNKIDKISTKLDMLNVIIVLRTIEKLPTEKLKEFRAKLASERLDKNVDVMNKALDNAITLEEFDTQLEKLYQTKQYKAYIVNYLIRHFGVRNMDLDLEIVFHKKGWKPEPDKNYLVRRLSSITYLRNKYKTVDTYGVQKQIITDKKFRNAVSELGLEHDVKHDNENTYKLLQAEPISNELRKLIIGKLTESQSFKMLIDDAYKRADTAEINRLSKSRGTDVKTILEFYNVNAEHQIIKKI